MTATIGIKRHFTTEGVHPYDQVEWERRDARIMDLREGRASFEQEGVEVPVFWSQNATNILAQKYFRGSLGSDEREFSLKQVADRVADTITVWGERDGYFGGDDEREAFRDELKWMIIHQRAAFNSPVWFNIGVPDVPQQASACFILAVEDSMDAIENWFVEEGIIFRGGSGAGINLSTLRGSMELIHGSANTSSGPMAFMQAADAKANAIKSGGKTRRAAKMVVMNADHPNIFDFIWCKPEAEDMMRDLKATGRYKMGFDEKHSSWMPFQNANQSVRFTDEMMQAVLDDGEVELRFVTTGEVYETVKARDMFRQIAEASWKCGDPGLQFDTTVNRWHTAHAEGRINGSNPCSEYMHLDNSACNLASINLLRFLDDNDVFDVEGYRQTIDVFITAQEILVGNADYPTAKITDVSHRFRQLGLGYANLGALLMALGMPYDSDKGRALAAALTAIMTGRAYATSTRAAARMGPFDGYAANQEHMLRVLGMHRDAVGEIDASLVASYLLEAAAADWNDAVDGCREHGVRNSQASLLAPTGTISFLMDTDTTGIEPDLSLVKSKKLVGGGTMSIVNQTVPRALAQLGYTEDEVREIVAYIDQNKSIVGSLGLRPEHLPVFACSMGDNTIHYMGHVKMMAAVQPFLSGAISKTVNMPETATVDEIEQLHIEAWRMGLKSIAIYRDNCKVSQPLSTAKKVEEAEELVDSLSDEEVAQRFESVVGPMRAQIDELMGEVEKARQMHYRRRMPKVRDARTRPFSVAGVEGYLTVGHYDDGAPGEVFVKLSKQGSTMAGLFDAFSIVVSIGLQYGVPPAVLVKKLTNMKFEPAGIVQDDDELKMASSVIDYLFRRLAIDYLSVKDRQDLGVKTVQERSAIVNGNGNGHADVPAASVSLEAATAGVATMLKTEIAETVMVEELTGELSKCCGATLIPAGACKLCSECFETDGCS